MQVGTPGLMIVYLTILKSDWWIMSPVQISSLASTTTFRCCSSSVDLSLRFDLYIFNSCRYHTAALQKCSCRFNERTRGQMIWGGTADTRQGPSPLLGDGECDYKSLRCAGIGEHRQTVPRGLKCSVWADESWDELQDVFMITAAAFRYKSTEHQDGAQTVYSQPVLQ